MASSMSDRLSKFLQHEIDTINVHLPKKVLSLKVIDKMEKPGVYLRDGTFNDIESKEIERIKNLVPDQFKGQVLLPIIITRRRDLGRGAYTVGGSDPNLYVILSLFDELPDYKRWKSKKRERYILYRYQLRKIRTEYPTSTVLAFA